MITMGIYCTHRWIEWQDEMLSFKNLQINSKIIGLKDLNRGNYEITFVVKDSVMTFDLPIAYEARQDSIAIGNSLSKEAQNGRFEIFRLDENAIHPKRLFLCPQLIGERNSARSASAARRRKTQKSFAPT